MRDSEARGEVPLDWFPSEPAALAAAASLEAAGIECTVHREDPAGLANFTGLSSARVFVARQDVSAARALIDAVRQDERGDHDRKVPSWPDVAPDVIARGLSEIRKRRRTSWILFFGFPVYAFVAFALLRHVVPEDTLLLTVFLPFCIAWVAVGWRAGAAKCPRCGDTYSIKRGFHHSWTQRCLHCGLPLRADASSPK
jgi:hypothetical protein